MLFVIQSIVLLGIRELQAIPELKEALGKYSESLEGALSATGADAGSKAITVAVKDLYRMMDNTSARNSASVIPLIMLQVCITFDGFLYCKYGM